MRRDRLRARAAAAAALPPPTALLVAAAALLALPPAAAAQTAAGQPAAVAEPDTLGWKNSIVASANFTQSAFSNWQGGGTGSVATAFALKGVFHDRAPRFDWRNTGKLEYGLVKQENEDVRKSVDLIDLETLYWHRIDFLLKPYASAGLVTQFDLGRNYAAKPDTLSGGELRYPATSRFADPLYLSQSAGFGYQIIPEDLSTRFGFSIRETITDEFRGYAIDDSESDRGLTFNDCINNPDCDRTKVETGLESVTEYAKKLAEKSVFTSKLGLFYSFEQPDEIDVRWQNDLAYQLYKIIGLSFKLELLYDQDVLDKWQTRQGLGLGLTYSLL